MAKIHTIVTHRRPHLDEIFAIWLLRRFGSSVFPGVETALVQFVNAGSKPPGGRAASQLEEAGVLAIGVFGGRFDEHPSAESDRKRDTCATTLVAEALSVQDDPGLAFMLKQVLMNDTRGRHSPLADMIQTMHDAHPQAAKSAIDPCSDAVIDWTWKFLNANYAKQDAYHSSETKQAFETQSTVLTMAGPYGRSIRVAVIQSENRHVAAYARSKSGGNCDLTIRREQNGHFQIQTMKGSGIQLYDVIRLLRIAEYQLKSPEERRRNGAAMRYETLDDFMDLEADGTIASVPELYFQEAGQFILNGSLTAKDVPASKLSLDQIVKRVNIAFDPQLFEPKHADQCRSNNCTASDNPCSWYGLGLKRCRAIRYLQHHHGGRSLPVIGQ